MKDGWFGANYWQRFQKSSHIYFVYVYFRYVFFSYFITHDQLFSWFSTYSWIGVFWRPHASRNKTSDLNNSDPVGVSGTQTLKSRAPGSLEHADPKKRRSSCCLPCACGTSNGRKLRAQETRELQGFFFFFSDSFLWRIGVKNTPIHENNIFRGSASVIKSQEMSQVLFC